MTKLKSNRQKTASSKRSKAIGRDSATRTPSSKSTKSRPPAKGAGVIQRGESVAKQAAHAASKQARIIALLRSPSGATIQAMAQVTGWQQQSVRGFLAGVVRKKLGLDLVSTAADGGRVYRILECTGSSTPSAKMSQAA